MKSNHKYGMFVLVCAFALLMAGCGAEKKDDLSLKVGLMPAVDAAPMLLAEQNGYFTDLGITVELQMFSNAQDRQSALQTQTIDGAITDLIAVAANVDGGFAIKATTTTNGVFPVLSKEDAAGKQTIKAGMMEVSVTNFLMDEWLGGTHQLEKVYINDIPARLAAIENGQLDMALFPEPMASMGALSGLIKTLYQPEDGVCPDVLVFTGKALADKEKAIKLFHDAYNKAVDELNQNPQAARDILMEKIPNVKPEIKDSILLPVYTKASLPDDDYIDGIIRWTADVMKKELKVTAGDLVDRSFCAQ